MLLSLQKRTGPCCTVEVGVVRQQNGATVEKRMGACSALQKRTWAVLCCYPRPFWLNYAKPAALGGVAPRGGEIGGRVRKPQ